MNTPILIAVLLSAAIIVLHFYTTRDFVKKLIDETARQRDMAITMVSYMRAESATDAANADGVRQRLAIENEALKNALRQAQQKAGPQAIEASPNASRDLLKTADGRVLELVQPEDLV